MENEDGAEQQELSDVEADAGKNVSEDDSGDDEEKVSSKAYQNLLDSLHRSHNAETEARKRRRLNVGRDSSPSLGQPPRHTQVSNDEAHGLGSELEDDPDDEIDSDDNTADDDDNVHDAEMSTPNGVAFASLNGVSQYDDDEERTAADPFDQHIASPDESELSDLITAARNNEWRTQKQSVYEDTILRVSAPNPTRRPLLLNTPAKTADDLPLKRRLKLAASQPPWNSFDALQQAISPYVFNYVDVMIGNRTPLNAPSLRAVACLHAVNHVLKGRDKILKNTARLAQVDEKDPLEFRDQGFTRPKVLILTETRQMCFKYAECILKVFAPEQQENRQRFCQSFTEPTDDGDSMPADFCELFEGNNDNNYLTTIKFTRNSMKYFSAFYASDIILASPLGLRRVIEHEDKRKRDYDFLSSVELLIMDQADAMQMQNWENVELIFKHLNLQPKDLHGCDVNRVRSWYLDNDARHLRQTLIFSAYVTPEMNKLFNNALVNVSGKAMLTPRHFGAITAATGLGIKQTFSRFAASSPADDPDARFKFFTSSVLPTLLRLPKPADGAQGILVFVPSYFDFLRVRNFFATSTLTSNISFGAISDYTETSDQRRARSHFMSGRHSVLLYTQRAHHFFRLRIRGAKKVVMYGVPDNDAFYRELVGGFLSTTLEQGRVGSAEVSVKCMFSKWDGLRMERIIGSERVAGVLGGAGDTFDFV